MVDFSDADKFELDVGACTGSEQHFSVAVLFAEAATVFPLLTEVQFKQD